MNATTARQGIAGTTTTGARNVKIKAPIRSYLIAAAACAATTAIATPLLAYFDPPNIVMLFLLTVLLIAMKLGYGPGVMSAFLSVALFDFFFVPPRFSFAVDDAQYLLTFAVMLVVALITAHLVASVRRQAAIADIRAQYAHALYEMARQLAGALTLIEVERITGEFLHDTLEIDSVIAVRSDDGVVTAGAGAVPTWVDTGVVAMASHESTLADLSPKMPNMYFPLIASRRLYGVLAMHATDERVTLLSEHVDLLDTVASLVSIVMERLARGREEESSVR
jgi:two-component system sensor histidine kinase KdpD